jgi:hypothetical protein
MEGALNPVEIYLKQQKKGPNKVQSEFFLCDMKGSRRLDADKIRSVDDALDKIKCGNCGTTTLEVSVTRRTPRELFGLSHQLVCPECDGILVLEERGIA